ncbi:MFS transporter [Phyllobacterium sp. 0TCS1.6C]|uniref:MFS transporter n=1 Tax=unclassified Phyllobacterium TaxID=2638441 RepID=UPI002263EB79|nr:MULTISPECIES: MFS transporter [unclassified Phyllobacterium]MCX8279196.1 MFS transporter [Phyllobacterium sp. 0TCS1.6C]MCX8293980.1 MFS transporter [Phyllobacterium sp. 0TCS1.6A]
MKDRKHTSSATGTATTTERLLILIAVCCAAITAPLAFTGIAVGLPSISHALGGNPIELNWALNAFILTFGSTLMAAGALADSYGRKRVFLSGLAAFGLLSVILIFVGNIVWFDILRALQGVGAAAAFSGGLAALAQEFDGTARLRAFSIVGANFGIGLAFGPVAAGWMIATFGWPAIFALLVVLAVAGLLLGATFMRESSDPSASGLDWKGAVSFTLALTALTFGILQAPESGWGDPLVIVLLIASLLLFVGFWLIERAVARPMLDLSLFRFPRFVGVQLLALAPAYAFVVLLVLMPVRFIGIEGMDEIAAGQMMIALSAPLLILPIAAGMLTRLFAPATICGAGLGIAAVGLFWLGQFPIGSDPVALIAPLLTIGVGIGLPWGLMDGLAVSVVPKERAGMATGIFSTSRVAGEGLALALVSAVLSGLIAASLGTTAGERAGAVAQRLVTGDLPEATALVPSMGRAALLQGYSNGFSTLLWLLCGITAMTAVVVFLFLGRSHETVEDIEDEAEGAAAATAGIAEWAIGEASNSLCTERQ